MAFWLGHPCPMDTFSSSVRIARSRKVSETEEEIRKLYIAVRTYQILQMLPEFFRNTKRAPLGCAVWSEFLRLLEF